MLSTFTLLIHFRELTPHFATSFIPVASVLHTAVLGIWTTSTSVRIPPRFEAHLQADDDILSNFAEILRLYMMAYLRVALTKSSAMVSDVDLTFGA